MVDILLPGKTVQPLIKRVLKNMSPQQATISALLSHVRKADIVGVSSLRRGVAEAIEAVAVKRVLK
jgi:hypothetical protein